MPASGWNRWHRGSRHERGYGAEWERTRERIMRRDQGLCQPCKQRGQITGATQVDHKVAKASDGTDDDENLQAICDDCHSQKTTEDRTGVVHGCSEDGLPLDPKHPWSEGVG